MAKARHDPGGKSYPVPNVQGTAVFSSDGKYRYVLSRDWGAEPGGRLIAFIGLNPAAADARNDDETVRKCWKWGKEWGYSSFVMLNIYAYRAVDRGRLGENGTDPVGPLNDEFISAYARAAATVVAAWGSPKRGDRARVRDVLTVLGNKRLSCLAENDDGSPIHPMPRRSLSPHRPVLWLSRDKYA